MTKKFRVRLTREERQRLEAMLSAGHGSTRRLTRVRLLLKADVGEAGPGWTDGRIAEALEIGRSTVERTRKRFVERGLEAVLGPRTSRRVYARKIDGVGEAHLIALACGRPPEGHARWTVRLLADRMVELGYVASVSKTTVHETLKKTNLSPGSFGSGASRRRRAASLSGGWKTCWTSINGPTTSGTPR